MWTSLEDLGMRSVRLKQLEEALVTTRKAIQLGRFVDLLYSARESMRLNDDMHRITLTMSKIASALLIMVDNLLWLARIGVCDIDRRKWFLTSCRLWLYSVTMCLVRDWFEVNRTTAAGSRHVMDLFKKRETDSLSELIAWINAYPALAVDIVKNSCDFFIPMSALNYCPLSAKMIGVLGVVSSGCAIVQLIDPSLRLHPS